MAKYTARRWLSADDVRAVLTYHPLSGWLTWKTNTGRGLKGDRAGGVTRMGYRCVGIGGHVYQEHQVVWLMMTGVWPDHEIDHIDMVRTNNSWGNLRSASHQQNAWNRTKQSNNTSGHKGVTWDPVNKKWRAQIRVNGRGMSLGRFAVIEDAVAVYQAKARELHGEYARVM